MDILLIIISSLGSAYAPDPYVAPRPVAGEAGGIGGVADVRPIAAIPKENEPPAAAEDRQQLFLTDDPFNEPSEFDIGDTVVIFVLVFAIIGMWVFNQRMKRLRIDNRPKTQKNTLFPPEMQLQDITSAESSHDSTSHHNNPSISSSSYAFSSLANSNLNPSSSLSFHSSKPQAHSDRNSNSEISSASRDHLVNIMDDDIDEEAPLLSYHH